jgi:hypothetical protein
LETLLCGLLPLLLLVVMLQLPLVLLPVLLTAPAAGADSCWC